MSIKSLTAAFAAVALAGLMAAAPAMADPQVSAPAPAPVTTPLASSTPAAPVPATPIHRHHHVTTLTVGGPALPAALAGTLLTREGWAPIAAGQDGETSWMAVLRKQGTNQVRLAEVADGTLKLFAEGTASHFKKPVGPLSTTSFDPNAGIAGVSPVQDDADGSSSPQMCFGSAAEARTILLERYAQAPIMQIVTQEGNTLNLYSGLDGPNTWALMLTRAGESQQCLVNSGIRFEISTNYPQAHWAAPGSVARQAAPVGTPSPAAFDGNPAVMPAPPVAPKHALGPA